MTSSEKVHFKKIHSAYKKDSKILLFFDFLNKMKKYDEKKIQKFGNNKSQTKNLLNSLLNAIMKSLQLYGNKNSIYLRLNQLLSEVELLWGKRAYSLGKRKINLGISLAKKHDLTRYQLMFGFWEYSYLLTYIDSYDIDIIKSKVENYEEVIQEISKRFKLFHIAALRSSFKSKYDIYDDARAYFKKDRYYIDAVNEKIAPKGNKGLFFYYNLLAGIKMELGEWEDSLLLCKKALEVIKREDAVDEIVVFNKISVFINIMTLCNLLHYLEEYKIFRKELNHLIEKYNNIIQMDLIQDIKILDLDNAWNNKLNFDEDKILEIEEFEKNTTESKGNAATSLAQYFLFNENYDKCLSILRTTFENKEYKEYKRNYIYAYRWMELICYYELNQETLFKSKHRSLYHHINYYRGIKDFEDVLLQSFKKSYAKKNEENDIFKNIYSSLKKKEKIIRTAFVSFDILEWIRRKCDLS